MDLIVPVLETDQSNQDQVCLAIAGVLTGGNIHVEHLDVTLHYRESDGSVRTLNLAGPAEDCTSSWRAVE